MNRSASDRFLSGHLSRSLRFFDEVSRKTELLRGAPIVMTNNIIVNLALSLALISGAYATGSAQSPADQVDARADSSVVARQLGSRDALVRQRAAEALARLAAVDQKKLIEGYQLQEKDKRVRLALDWALYRIGKSEALFRIVRELDSSRHDQAVAYLMELDGPALLYPFLIREDNQPKTTVGLLEALAQMGDAASLDLVKPFRDSFYPGVAEAAELATEKIARRLAQTEVRTPTRPRTVDKTDQSSP
jgi:HEAT repeat protein